MDDRKHLALWDRLTRGMRGISFQLAFVLSLAVLPIGIIAVRQSLEFAKETRRHAVTLLSGLTAESAALERRLIEAGLRIDPTLIASTIFVRSNRAECTKALADFIAIHPIFRSVKYVTVYGISQCASDGQESDLHADASHLKFLARPKPTIDRISPDDSSAAPVLRVLQPVKESGTLIGYLSLVLQSFPLPPVQNHSGIPTPLDVILFNMDGTVLTSTLDVQGVAARLPPGAGLDLLLDGPDGFVEKTDTFGDMAGFMKVTLIPDAVFAIGIWSPYNPVSQTDLTWSHSYAIPLMMWLVSLATALVAAQRMVIRPIKMLRDEMRRFALGQRNNPIILAPGAAIEIQETVNTFNKLELIVSRNEAALALTAEGKLLLLKEVHHRVKNNLQMISSIISIQRRKTGNPEVEKVLRSLRDRVLSIAAVDQSLYTSGDVLDVRADLLIASITERLLGVNLEPGQNVLISTHFEPVMLHADQIGPLSLLANEAITNALKYVGKPDAGPASIDIVLTWDTDRIRFSVANSVGSGSNVAEGTRDGTKLGMVLIDAFADQLAAEVESGLDAADQKFHISVKFRPNGLAMVQNPSPVAEE